MIIDDWFFPTIQPSEQTGIMKFTRVSNNELRAILNNAYEAFISNKNDFEEMASTIFWLETYDFSGIDMFLNHLDQHLNIIIYSRE